MKTSFLRPVKKLIKKVLRYPEGYTFRQSSSIEVQEIKFFFRGKRFTVEADASTPLYDTITEIADADCYQLESVDFSSYNKQSIGLDIGANIGISTLILSQVFPGKIICFEPIPENCKRLMHNLEINHITNVEIWPFALGDLDGKLQFYKSSASVSGSIYQNGGDLQEVKSVSLATLIKKYPKIDLAKLDCEGSEYGIIFQFLSHKLNIPYITGEIHYLDKNRNEKTLINDLKRDGYQVSRIPEVFGRRGLSHFLAKKPLQQEIHSTAEQIS